MKKQVTFAERLQQDDAFPRRTGMNESKTAASVSFSRIHRPAAAACEPRLQHVATVRIPKTITAAPFLKHAALTPAQREYLYTVAASHSGEHVRSLITQHYMNVLHRCIRAGYDPERDDLAVASAILPVTDESNKHPSNGPAGAKHKQKINISPRKSFLPKIPNRRARSSNTSTSKQSKMKTRTTASPTMTRKSPGGVRRSKLLEKEREEEEEEEGLDDSVSECLSSLSMTEWEDDAFSYL